MKILIVDDEKIICEGLRTLVQRLELPEVTSVRTAYRASDAVQIARELVPDILITDIRMPEKNGLDLIADVRRELPDIRAIVVTGHDDFELVRTALRLETVDYLLKPATRDELRGALAKAVDEVRAVHRSREAGEQEHGERFRAVVDAAWAWFAEEAIVSDETLWNLESTLADQLELPWLALVAVENPTENTAAAARALSSAEQSHEQTGLLVRVRNADGAAVAVVAGSTAEAVRGFAERAVLRVSDDTHLSFTEPRRGLRTLRRQWAALQSARARKLAGPGHVHREVPTPTVFDQSVDDAADAIAERVLRDTSAEGALDAAPLAAAIAAAAASGDRLLALWRAVRRALCARLGQIELPSIARAYSPEDAATALLRAVRDLRGRSEGGHHTVVRRALEFVADHYHEQHTMQDVADRLGMSYTYFSTLFKDHTGETYSHHLTRVRMEKARVLLTENRLSVADVATRVGYLYPKHFTRAFKKYWGVTPAEAVRGAEVRPDLPHPAP